ncbi:MAG: FG-GAP repeat domain-containing protein [Bryobacteraceae bacterium]
MLLGCSSAPPEMFRHHYVSRDTPSGNVGFGTPALADFDQDGDLDFLASDRSDGVLSWFEYQGPDQWVRHVAGSIELRQLGAAVLDVDGDGWPDFVIGGYWFRNPQNPRDSEFVRYRYDSRIGTEIHDIVSADIDGDGKLDIVAIGDREGLFWYKVPENPARDADWPRTLITNHGLIDRVRTHSGIFPNGVADLDGDGDPDIVLPDRWLENRDRGTSWIHHDLPFGRRGPWGLSARSWIVDLNGDSHMDIVMADSDGQNSGLAWLENNGKTPPAFTVHYLANHASGTRGSFHSLHVADFNLDGRLDIFTVEQEDPKILPVGAGPRWILWENLGGPGVRFEQRIILDAGLGGHDVQVGDVDGDGDPDIVSKIWRVWPGNANNGRIHIDYLENRTR